MNILDEIIAHKKLLVETRKKTAPIRALEQSTYFQRSTVSMKSSLASAGKSGIITEFKRKSPSKGMINPHATIEKVAAGYVEAGASALSVLTDETFFGGSSEDLIKARNSVRCPILRKDFTIDEYQLVEAKAIGADAVLLIAAALSSKEIQRFTHTAHALNLEVLLEVHDEGELLANRDTGVDMIGVNNRNLKTFEVNLDTSIRLAPLIPENVIKVAESGIETPHAVQQLKASGFRGFLIGQTFMQSADPGAAAAIFIRELQALETNPKNAC